MTHRVRVLSPRFRRKPLPPVFEASEKRLVSRTRRALGSDGHLSSPPPRAVAVDATSHVQKRVARVRHLRARLAYPSRPRRCLAACRLARGRTRGASSRGVFPSRSSRSSAPRRLPPPPSTPSTRGTAGTPPSPTSPRSARRTRRRWGRRAPGRRPPRALSRALRGRLEPRRGGARVRRARRRVSERRAADDAQPVPVRAAPVRVRRET